MSKDSLSIFDGYAGANEGVIARSSVQLGVLLPTDYLSFMGRSNGGEGPIGENGFIVLWPIEELTQLNLEYAVNEFAPGLVLFGSDGGDTAYAFDTSREMAVVEVPFIGMSLSESIELARTFSDFLALLMSR